MPKKYKEKHKVKYSCGCIKEIGLDVAGRWQPTGTNKYCKKHKK